MNNTLGIIWIYSVDYLTRTGKIRNTTGCVQAHDRKQAKELIRHTIPLATITRLNINAMDNNRLNPELVKVKATMEGYQ